MKHPRRTPAEFRRQRRERRLRRAAELQTEISRWAAQRGFLLRVFNQGHYWLFETLGFTAEWWPSTGKLVLDRDYRHGHHVSHWAQVAAILKAALTAPFGPNQPAPYPASAVDSDLPGGTGPAMNASSGHSPRLGLRLLLRLEP